MIYAGLGRCDEASAEGKCAVELLPESKDVFDGPILAVSRARIAVRRGDHASALSRLARSLQIKAGITLAELRHDPTWDPLRSDPQFQRPITKNGKRG
ncbi:MAG: TPR end-of-group domain-containing protein [Chthoniobacterales bacterium]